MGRVESAHVEKLDVANMKVWILVLILRNVSGVQETPVFVGAFSSAAVCEKNLQIHSHGASTTELRCIEERVLDW
jgi:hypothetical protein